MFDNKVEAAFQYLPSPAPDQTAFALLPGNMFITFNVFAPNAPSAPIAISGLQTGENISGWDFRPKTADLVAVTNQNRVYIINPGTGAATQIGTTAFTPPATSPFFVDFNPAVDRVRIVGGTNNFRLNPDNGAIANAAPADQPLTFATGDANAGKTPNAVSAAYTNNFLGATATTLYVIEAGNNVLTTQGTAVGVTPAVSPNLGQLFTVGSLGLSIATGTTVGFDIDSPRGTAFASITPTGATGASFYTINLQTGAASLIGQIGATPTQVLDVAVGVRVTTVFATDGINLLTFNAGKSSTGVLTRPFVGLNSGEQVVAIDFRTNGQLYGLTSTNRIVRVNTTTGKVSQVGGAAVANTISGAVGFDFNPAVDRIRVVNGANNFRLNPDTGAIANAAPADQPLTFATGDANAGKTPTVAAAAYSNNFAGTTATGLYVLETTAGGTGQAILASQGSLPGAATAVSPNLGNLFTIGNLNVTSISRVAGFDIAKDTNAAFVALTTTGQTAGSSMYSINLATGAATLLGSIGGANAILDIAVANLVETVYAVTQSGKIISFVSTQPSKILSTATITGLASGDTIVGADFRPSNGMLYALTNSGRLYIVNPFTGGASQVGSTPVTLSGTVFEVDFNPVPDRLRVVSNQGQNLRVNPIDGTLTATDTPLAFAAGDTNAGKAPIIVGAGYDNNFAGAKIVTLYELEQGTGSLVRQGSPGGTPSSPNAGQLQTIGSLGVSFTAPASFDVVDETQSALASLTTGGMSQLYNINLRSGAATLVGPIGAGTDPVIAISAGNFGAASNQPDGATTTNAASFASDFVAPGSLVALFGKFQTTNGQLAVFSNTPFPTTLGGLSATVNGTPAGLLVASNFQINLALPSPLPSGPATVVVTNADGTTSTSLLNVQQAAPGIFTFLANGVGAPAAIATTDGVNFVPAFNNDGTPKAISAGSAAQPNVLVLFTTGLRNTPVTPGPNGNVAAGVNVSFGTTNATVQFAGPAPTLLNVDQINVVVPPSLAGAGVVPVKVTIPGVNNYSSNTVMVRIQ